MNPIESDSQEGDTSSYHNFRHGYHLRRSQRLAFLQTRCSRKRQMSDPTNAVFNPGDNVTHPHDATNESSSLAYNNDFARDPLTTHRNMTSPNDNNATNVMGQPRLTIGVLADIQWAPIPNGASYSGVPRFYRHALETARHAAQHFQSANVDLVLNLGDIIDGKCQEVPVLNDHDKNHPLRDYQQEIDAPHNDDDDHKGNPGYAALLAAIDALSHYRKGPVLHTYGNHELYNLSRETLGRKLNIPFVREPCGDLVGYYSYVAPNVMTSPSLHMDSNNSNMIHHHNSNLGKIRFVVLDSYDIAIMKRCPNTSRKRKIAETILAKNNHNFPQFENSPEGLIGLKRRFVAFNGAVDTPQLTWLRNTLEEAKNNGETVIILSHQPILPGSSSAMCLIWNYVDVLRVLRDYSCTIAAAFAGHAHKGGYKRDSISGIHFRVFEAVLESEDPIKTYAFVDVYDNRLIVRGMGKCLSAIYDLDHLRQIVVE